ncbi:hypothetical protein ACFP81_07575 [Deinococcus lacus]|uniref:Flagella basal body P-ring formation protein FlgA n=1 Tax=Deinococcus lacus TaxID=392561 RepID=A0ABW1YCR6_9DEIO
MPQYDPRLGLSREEFQRYTLYQPSLVGVGRATLKLRRAGQRVIFEGGAGSLGVLQGLSIDLLTGELQVPEGFATRPTALLPQRLSNSAVNIRSGFVWSLQGNNVSAGNAIRGQLVLMELSNGQVLLSYRKTSMIRRTITKGEVVVGYQRP